MAESGSGQDEQRLRSPGDVAAFDRPPDHYLPPAGEDKGAAGAANNTIHCLSVFAMF